MAKKLGKEKRSEYLIFVLTFSGVWEKHVCHLVVNFSYNIFDGIGGCIVLNISFKI